MSAVAKARADRVRQRKVAREAHKHPVNRIHHDEASFGERLADRMAGVLGSWRFIITQTIFMVVWIVFNAVAVFKLHWDPYPFIFLNLVLSFQATYAGPILLLAANRNAQKDRLTLEHAETEAVQGEERLREILLKIKQNTEYTNQILKELEAAKAL
ncbi:MAG TPA: DUF1003 domain-containing protein [Candidatus Dormibacteraeota bacterium]|jgi:uncharacterized membrane protein